jgi:outer membrane protein with beta-barrel domain
MIQAMRHAHAVFLTFTLFPAVLSAQTTSPEVFVRAGLVKLWDDEGNLGTGPSIGGGVGIRLPHGIAIEGLVERHSNDRNFSSGVVFKSTAAGVVGRVVKYIGPSHTRPYFGGGAGVARIRTMSRFPGFPRNDRTTTSRTLAGFAGIRFDAGRHLFLRPEFELSHAGEHLRIGGSLAAGFGW